MAYEIQPSRNPRPASRRKTLFASGTLMAIVTAATVILVTVHGR